MFALSTLVTFLRASRKATRAIRSTSPTRVHAGVVRGVAVEAAVAEVDAAGELADHQEVHALDPVALERARVEQRGARPDRAQVREQAELLAEAEEPLLGAGRVRVGGVPLRPAHGREQDGVRAPAGVEHLVRERRAVGVDRSSAHEPLVELELTDRVEELARRGHDLGPDAVTGQEDDSLGHGGGS